MSTEIDVKIQKIKRASLYFVPPPFFLPSRVRCAGLPFWGLGGWRTRFSSLDSFAFSLDMFFPLDRFSPSSGEVERLFPPERGGGWRAPKGPSNTFLALSPAYENRTSTKICKKPTKNRTSTILWEGSRADGGGIRASRVKP